jgi:hypothetical protein
MAFGLGRGCCYLNYFRACNIFDVEIKGTKQAFETMLQERGISKRLGVDTSTVANWKTYLKQGKSISLDKMEEMLIRSGASVTQVKLWEIDKISYDNLQLNMDHFYKELAACKIGDVIEADFSGIGNMDQTLTINAVRRHAKQLNSVIILDSTLIEMVKFKFIEK